MDELLELNNKIDQLQDLFYKHKHLGTDKSQKLSSAAGSFAKGQTAINSGHVLISDPLCTTSSVILAIHDLSFTPTLLGVLTTIPHAGSFDIYSIKAATNGTIETSDNGLIDYVIFY